MGPTLPSKANKMEFVITIITKCQCCQSLVITKTNKMELSDKVYSKMSILSKFGDKGKEHSGFVNKETVGLTSSREGGTCTYNIVI